MRLLARCLFSVFFGSMCSYSLAQNISTSIEGKVLTAFLLPAEAATVKLLSHPDSTLMGATISDKNGFFAFRDIKPGTYFISVSKVGYRRLFTVKYQVVANIGIKTEIKLEPLTHQLKEVSIVSKKDFIEVRPDKTIVNVDKSIVSAGNSMLEVLKIAPGVRVVDDEILFKAGQKALIAINGKPVLLTGEQLADMLKSYQSSQVSQIELIQNPSAKYDAAGGGVINIILKKSRDTGLRVNISESAAIGQKYKLNTTTNLNYRYKKINLFGSYSFTKSEVPRRWQIDRNIVKDNRIAGYSVDYTGTTTLESQAFNVGGDISITPRQNIGVLFHGFINPIGINKDNRTLLKTNDIPASSIVTNSFIDRHIDNLNYNINYRGVFGKQNQHILTADVDYSDYDRNSLENLKNTFYDTGGSVLRDPLFFQVNSPAHINVRSAKIDYQRRIRKNIFEAGVKISKVKSVNRIDFKQLKNGNSLLVDTLTDHFTYNEQISAAYANYTANFGKTIINVGLRAEETRANRLSLNPSRVADTSYFNLFPNIQITHDLNDDHQFILNYNRGVSRPTYQDLNPFVGYIDQYAYSTGNPYLRPQYTSSFQFSDIFRYKFKASVGLNVTKYFSTTVFKQNDVTGVYTTTKENIGTRYQYAIELIAPFTITSWWEITNNIAATYEKYAYTIPGAQNRWAYDLLIKVNQNFSITKKLRADITGSYETPTYYGIKSYREQFFMSAGIGYTVLNERGNIKLAVTDIFNTQIDRYDTRFLNLNLRGREKQGTRFVVATFTYRFGNIQLRSVRNRTGGISDEQSRLGGSTSEN